MNLNDLLTASGKYPERTKHKELNDELIANGEDLVSTVNDFLSEAGIQVGKISSGFRPSDVNSKIANAAKRSLHTRCLAVDFEDPTGEIAKKCKAVPHLLKKYKLFLENPEYTKGWCHLDKSPTRSDRASRMFNP
jgi:Peptidase M15